MFAVRTLPYAILLLYAMGCRSPREAMSPIGAGRVQDPRWVRVDSLDAKGLPVSARELGEALLDEAQQQGDWRSEFRAWMVLGRLHRHGEVPSAEFLFRMEHRLRELSDTTVQPLSAQESEDGVPPRHDRGHIPLRQLLHSSLGEAWWTHYQYHRWEVMDRTPVAFAELPPDGDPATWDQRQYMRRVVRHFMASMEPLDTLEWIPAADLQQLLMGPPVADPRASGGPWPDRTGALDNPMLFDLLAHRAFAVFGNPELRMAEPEWHFRLDDPVYFEVYGPSTYMDLRHRDSTAWEFQALRTLRLWERSHLADDQPTARTAATLERLAFVYRHSVLPDRDSLYYRSLDRLRSRIERLPIWSEVTLAMAQWHAGRAMEHRRLEDDDRKWEKKAARDLCLAAIARHPGSFGARNAKVLLAELEQPSLALQVERAVAPMAPFHAALSYANTSVVWLRVVKDPRPDDPLGAGPQWSAAEREQRLLAQRSVLAWRVELPDDGDLHTHLVELPVQQLPLGHYVMLASAGEGFRHGADRIVHAAFQVTGLAMADRSHDGELDLVVVDRVSGAPLAGVKAWAYVRNVDHTGIRRYIGVADFETGADGMVRTSLHGQRGQLVWKLAHGADELTTGAGWVRGAVVGSGADSLRTFLFTDRAIYRPGQPLHFKGLVTVQRGVTTVAKAGHSTWLVLRGGDGRHIDSLQVVTDAFGSFHGTTSTPQGLPGPLLLIEAHGMHSVLVEEYKRPTFEVAFDSLATAPRLEQLVEVPGRATSYAGVPLDGARVHWTVVRSVRFPWWSRLGGMPGRGGSAEVASGTATTDAEGRFAVAFKAQGDRSVGRLADPTYLFRVEASVTDIQGETQQGATAIPVGHRAIELVPGMGDRLDRRTTTSIPVAVHDLAGLPVDLPVDVRIVRLRPPTGPPPPARAWERPDRFLPGQVPEHPFWNDATQAEVAEVVLERAAWRPSGAPLPVPGMADWATGAYRMELRCTDPYGTEVSAMYAFTLLDPEAADHAFIMDAVKVTPLVAVAEPGEDALLLVGTALPQAHVLVEVERQGAIVDRQWLRPAAGQQQLRIPVQEGDRGGLVVHTLAVERGRAQAHTHDIAVPWSNKALQVEWSSFRDKLRPGDREEWRLRLKGADGAPAAAQVLATLYDASLDHFAPHGFALFSWPTYQARRSWSRTAPFGAGRGASMPVPERMLHDSIRLVNRIHTFGFVAEPRYGVMRGGSWKDLDGYRMDSDEGPVVLASMAAPMDDTVAREAFTEAEEVHTAPQVQPVRTDFRETAFFFPDLLTDRDGAVMLRFTMPDALTRWRLLGMAHTPDLQLAGFERTVVTNKPLMVVPNLPRFLRHGDRITLTAKINALEGGVQQGTARLELLDPRTGARIDVGGGRALPSRAFRAAPGSSADVAWEVAVPPGLDLVAVRITATAGAFSDGEERLLPVLSDRMLVTQSMPIAVHAAGTHTFTMPGLAGAGASRTLRHHGLQLEFTPNPAWHAVQALPYLADFPHECAEQLFGRYFANVLAARVVQRHPRITAVFEQWRSAGAPALLSALERDPALRAIALRRPLAAAGHRPGRAQTTHRLVVRHGAHGSGRSGGRAAPARHAAGQRRLALVHGHGPFAPHHAAHRGRLWAAGEARRGHHAARWPGPAHAAQRGALDGRRGRTRTPRTASTQHAGRAG